MIARSLFTLTFALMGALGFAGVAKAAAPPTKVSTESLVREAEKELLLSPEDLTTGVLPTPATVRSRVEAVQKPSRPLSYRIGVSLQPYQPEGTMRVGDLQPYNLSALGTKPMVSLEAQWLPLTLERFGGSRLGAFASVGYAQHTVDLRSPSGATFENTTLNTLKLEAGATTSWQLPRDSKWSLHGNLGFGRWDEVQSSTSSYANQSASLLFGALGVGVERSLVSALSAFANYEYRSPIRVNESGAAIPRNNVMVGFFGNFE